MRRSTCRGECSLSDPLVTPQGRCHHGPLTNGPGRIPPNCVSSSGADTVAGGGGGGKLPRPGPLPASPLDIFCPEPPPVPSAGCCPSAPCSRVPPVRAAPLVLGPLSVRGLVLSCSLFPPSHRYDARQFRGQAMVEVARARVTRTTCKVHSNKPVCKRGLCHRVPPPPRPVAPVPCLCCSRRPRLPSRWPQWRPWLFSWWWHALRSPPFRALCLLWAC